MTLKMDIFKIVFIHIIYTNMLKQSVWGEIKDREKRNNTHYKLVKRNPIKKNTN